MEKLRLLDGTEYTLAINGVAELGEKVQIKVVTEDSLDSIYEKFTAENAATMTVIGESFTQKLTGYTQMGSMVTRDTNALIEVKYPEVSKEDDTPTEAEEVRGTIITFEMCKERIENKVEQNRADIDYLLMMEEQA